MSETPRGERVRRRLVVIGNGMAGARTVEEIVARSGGEQFEITVFGEEPYGNYNRILLSGLLNGTHAFRDLLLHPVDWYASHGVTLHVGERVTRIDREARIVETSGGRRESYDLLLIATGSRALLPPIENLRMDDGALRPGVHVFRTVDDCRRIAASATESRRAVVIGGGLLGLEAAYGLRDHGLEVHVVHRNGHLMDRQLDPEAGAILQATMERLGIQVHLSRQTAAVLGDDGVTGVEFADGSRLDCDMIVVACGITPNVEPARECGLAVERAILVDDQMRSVTDPDIYAVGECVQHRGQVYGLVAPLWEQAQVLADHLTGRRPERTYQGSRLSTRLKVVGVEVAAMGQIQPRDEQDEVVLYSEPRRGVYKKLIIRDGALVGAILLGDGGRAPYLIQAFDRGSRLPSNRAALLFDLGAPSGAVSLEDMADDTTVCHCNGVSKGEVRECLAGGALGVNDVMQATRAGTGCGSCKTLLRGLVDQLARKADVREPQIVGAAG